MTTARTIRQLSRSSTLRVGRASLGDAYSNTLLTVLALAYAGSLLAAPAQWSKFADPAAPHWIDDHAQSSWAASALAFCGLLSLFGLAVQVGPVALTRAQAQWWPPLPVSRRDLLLPAYLTTLVTPVLGLTAAAAVLGFSLQGTGATLTLCLLAASLVALTHAAAVWLQICAHARVPTYTRWMVPGVLLGIVAAASAGPHTLIDLTLLAVDASDSSGNSLDVALAAVVLSGAAVCCAARGLPSLTTHALRGSAAQTEQLWVAILSMDSAGARRGRTHCFGQRPRRDSSSRIFTAPGPRRTALSVQLRLLRPAVSGLLSCALLPTAVLAVPALNTTAVLTCTLLVCSFRAVALVGGFAQLVDQSPNLLRHFPLSRRGHHQLLHAGPCLLLLAWSSTTFAAMALSGATPEHWPYLVLPLAIGLTITTITSAHQPATNWNAPMLATAMGVLPTGVIRSLTHGKITTLAVLAPTLAAVETGSAGPALLTIQSITTALVAGWTLTRTHIQLHRPWQQNWL